MTATAMNDLLEPARQGAITSPADDLRELSDLLAPLSPEAFTTAYWCKRPVFIKGSPDKLERLVPGGFSRADFFRVARASAAAKSRGFQLLARGRQERYDVFGSGPRPSLPIQPEQMEWLFAAGANLRADNLVEPRLARLAACVKAQLQFVGDIFVAATLSPEGNGWPAHIDRSSVFFIQAEGKKRFTISPAPVTPWPDKGALIAPDGSAFDRDGVVAPWEEFPPVDMSGLFDVVLEPGDVLFLPPGTIHATEALTDASLTLDVLVSHDSVLDVISRTLANMLRSDPNWRHLPAVDVTRATAGEIPAEVAAFMNDRLVELRAIVNGLTPTSPELNREWQRSVADPGEITLPLLGHAPRRKSRSVEPGDRLCLTRRAPLTMALGTTDDGLPTIDVYVAGQEVNVVGAWVPFVRMLVAAREFRADAAMAWAEGPERYPWELVRDNLEALLAQGILERA